MQFVVVSIIMFCATIYASECCVAALENSETSGSSRKLVISAAPEYQTTSDF